MSYRIISFLHFLQSKNKHPITVLAASEMSIFTYLPQSRPSITHIRFLTCIRISIPPVHIHTLTPRLFLCRQPTPQLQIIVHYLEFASFYQPRLIFAIKKGSVSLPCLSSHIFRHPASISRIYKEKTSNNRNPKSLFFQHFLECDPKTSENQALFGMTSNLQKSPHKKRAQPFGHAPSRFSIL